MEHLNLSSIVGLPDDAADDVIGPNLAFPSRTFPCILAACLDWENRLSLISMLESLRTKLKEFLVRADHKNIFIALCQA